MECQINLTHSIIRPGGYDLVIAFYDVAVNSLFKNHFTSSKGVPLQSLRTCTYRKMGK